MNILGLSFGMPEGNSEILVKEALLGAREQGADVEYIRVADCKVLPCTGCHACMMQMYTKNVFGCIRKDDFPLIFDRMLWADGIIFSVPVTTWTPNSLFRVFCDKFPTYDVAGLRKAGFMRPNSPADQRLFQHRSLGFISVGGSREDAPLGLAMMENMSHCLQMDVADGFLADGLYAHGQAVEHGEHLSRARALGTNVARESVLPRKERGWHGEEGLCPVCHNSLFQVHDGAAHVTCCDCAIDGPLVEKNGTLMPAFSPMQLRFPRSTEEEMLHHHWETDVQMADFMAHKDEILEKLKLYSAYEVELVKPARHGK